MSNEETLQEYNGRLEENNVSLANVLTTIKNLPSSSGGSSSNIYSTEETLIGTWLGKPLYRKVVVVDMEPNGETTVSKSNLGLSEADMIIVNFGTSVALYYQGVSSTKYGFSPILYYSSSSDRAQVYINADRNMIIRNTNQNPRKYYIVLEYTKTTD